VADTDNPEVGPWRDRSFVVVHREHNVVGAVTGMITEAIVAAKVMQEQTTALMENIEKSVQELGELERSAPVKNAMKFN
jgi:hypothetical protein